MQLKATAQMNETSNQTDERIVPLRLQRFLARAGVASRRKSEDLMTAGRVRVNGVVVKELGSKVNPLVDEVTVDNKKVRCAESPVYLMLYKPQGYVTTMNDPQGRRCVASLVPIKLYPGLFPVGRLDSDTTGLLFFTTSGDMGQALLHPSKHVDKHYIALVKGVPSQAELKRLRKGVPLDDRISAPAEVELLSADNSEAQAVIPQGLPKGTSLVGLTIHEGKKHQVKRMLSFIGHEVLALHRDSFGPLHLVDIKRGHWRLLTQQEQYAIEQAAGS